VTPRSRGPAGACLSPPQVRAREGRPRSPLREELGPSGSSSLGVSPPLPPDATGFGNASATSRDRPEASSSSADMGKAALEDRRIARTHPRPPFLVADGGLQSNRGEPGGEERDPSDPQAPTTLDTQEEPCPTLRSCQLLTANGIAGHPLTCLLPPLVDPVARPLAKTGPSLAAAATLMCRVAEEGPGDDRRQPVPHEG